MTTILVKVGKIRLYPSLSSCEYLFLTSNWFNMHQIPLGSVQVKKQLFFRAHCDVNTKLAFCQTLHLVRLDPQSSFQYWSSKWSIQSRKQMESPKAHESRAMKKLPLGTSNLVYHHQCSISHTQPLNFDSRQHQTFLPRFILILLTLFSSSSDVSLTFLLAASASLLHLHIDHSMLAVRGNIGENGLQRIHGTI